MLKKIIAYSALMELLLALVLYFTIGYQFDHNFELKLLLESNSLISTSLRLSLYVIPGVHIIGGLFGMVFSNKKLLIFIGTLMVLASIFTIYFSNNNLFMLILGIILLILSLLYLIGSIIYKE